MLKVGDIIKTVNMISDEVEFFQVLRVSGHSIFARRMKERDAG
jgi:hypothetical protein